MSGKIPEAAKPWLGLVAEASQKYGVPQDVILGVMQTESSFKPNAVSGTNVRGLMQVTQNTYTGLGFKGDRADPRNSVMAGTKYLADLYKKYGNWDDAFAAYNGGGNAVTGMRQGKWGGIGPAKQKEIRNYANTVNKFRAAMTGADFTPVQGATPAARVAPGLITPGNINIFNRPIVKNPDGTFSTVESFSVNLGNGEVLLPTIRDDGTRMTQDEAIEEYRRTGQHLGIYQTPEAATAAGQALHTQQEQYYSPQVSPGLQQEQVDSSLFDRASAQGLPISFQGQDMFAVPENEQEVEALDVFQHYGENLRGKMIQFMGQLEQAEKTREPLFADFPTYFDDRILRLIDETEVDDGQ